MKKILIALDYSKASKSAFEYGLLLAKDLKAELTLLNVVMPITNNGEYPSEIIEFAKENEAHRATTLLKKLTTYYPDSDADKFIKHNVKIDYLVKEGIFAPTIVHTAKTLDCDLIIVGAKSGNLLSKIILGSTTKDLIRQTTIPTLVIPEGYTYTSVDSIAFATALDGKDKEAITWVRNLASTLKANVHPFFVSELPYDISNVEEEIWESRFLPAENGYSNTVTVIRKSSFAKGVDFYLEQHPTDVCAMFIPKRSFINQIFHFSKTQQMAVNTTIPLLVYHA